MAKAINVETITATNLATVATSGSYNDLSNKPSIASTTTDGLMSASDKSLLDATSQNLTVEVARAQKAEGELLKRVQGTSGNSNPFNDPFVARTISSLSELESFSLNDPINGMYRFKYNSYIIELLVCNDTRQVVRGFIEYNNGWVATTTYNIYIRIGQSAWKLIGGELVKNIVDNNKSGLANEIARAQKAEYDLKQELSALIGESPETLDTIHEIAAWILNDESGAAAMAAQINKNRNAIVEEELRAIAREDQAIEITEKEIERAKTAEQKIVYDVEQGNTVTALAREIYSLQGRTDTAAFLKRTTAGGTSISDGVATLKQVGGNIVKNLVDGVLLSGLSATGGSVTVENGIVVFSSSSIEGKGSLRNYKTPNQTEAVGHKYYQACLLKCSENPNGAVFVGWGALANSFPAGHAATAQSHTDWQWVSTIYTSFLTGNYHSQVVGDKRTSDWGKIYVKNYFHIDLTEMYGAGKEPTLEECDALFSTIGALPKGLSVAQPTDFKSVGYNQWNPSNVLVGKNIITDGVEDDPNSSIAIVECLPCKVGATENNGYRITYGENREGEDIIVYYSPLNPMEVTTGELFLDQLTKKETTGTYVPPASGYLIVCTPSTDKFCANFLWSGDRAATDYADYIESTIALPVVPQMSEWGLAGISTSGIAARDTIDYENKKYIKRIGRIDIGTMSWARIEMKTPDKTSSYFAFGSYALNNKFLKPAVNKVANGITDRYTPIPSKMSTIQEISNRSIMLYNTGYLHIRDDSYTSVDSFKAAMQGVYLYYELAVPEEYPIVTKTAPNYIGSDYGTEQFVGSIVPLNANILFYIRALASETRNFLDRLMAGLGVSDVVAAADRIVAALTPTEENVSEEEITDTEEGV